MVKLYSNFKIIFQLEEDNFKNREKVKNFISKAFPNYELSNVSLFEKNKDYLTILLKGKIGKKFISINDDGLIPIHLNGVLQDEIVNNYFSKTEGVNEFINLIKEIIIIESDEDLKFFKKNIVSSESPQKDIAFSEKKNYTLLPISFLSTKDKPRFFANPLDDENNKLLRFGTVADGSCFFHSVLKATDDEYSELEDDNDRTRYASKIRKRLEKYYSRLKRYRSLMDGNIAFHKFINEFATQFSLIQEKKLKNYKPIKIFGETIQPEIFNLLKEIRLMQDKPIGYSRTFYNEINDLTSFTSSQGIDFDAYKNNIINIFSNHFLTLHPELKGEEIHSFIKLIVDNSENNAHAEFVDDLGDISCFFNDTFLALISDYFNIDIYIIKSEKRLLAKTYCSLLKGRPSIIILNIGELHYELLGRTSLDKNGKFKGIKVRFNPDDKMIIKMRKIICNEDLNNSEITNYLKLYLQND
jgi:hypothetical protein